MLSPDRPFLISPPFGAYFRSARAYSVLGSYTRHPRPGRTAQVLRTVRPLGRSEDGSPKGWVNKVGLRNSGWDAVYAKTYDRSHVIISLAPLVEEDWLALETWRNRRTQRPTIEINVWCPNIAEHPELPFDAMIRRLIESTLVTDAGDVIWKLPPVPASVDAALRLADLGARYVHLSNTLPSPIGDLSGAVLREVNLPLVERTADALERAGFKDFRNETGGHPTGWSEWRNDVCIIAGGGILAPEHVRAYRDAGATRFSLATAFFWPPRAYRIMREGSK